MRMKRFFIVISIIALLMAFILIALEAYYVAVALIAGALIIGHRELWSLITRKTLPPIDERIRENTSKAVRNGFIFFALALAFLLLPFSVGIIEATTTVHILGGLFVAGGAVYLFSYIFYDRAEPKLSERGLKMIKTFILVAGISLGVFIISVFLHNALSALFDIEEPVFFFIAVFIAPVAFTVGIIGSLVMFIRGLLGSTS